MKDDFSAIARVCHELSENERSNGVKYFEVSINPHHLLTLDKSPEKIRELLELVSSTFEETEATNGVKFGIILQYERGMFEEGKHLLSLCSDLKESNVVGLELGGHDTQSEEIKPEDFFYQEDLNIFEEAKESQVHRSIIVENSCSSEVVFQAIEKLHAERIVFGYCVSQDDSLYMDCITNKIPFITTPTLSLCLGLPGDFGVVFHKSSQKMKIVSNKKLKAYLILLLMSHFHTLPSNVSYFMFSRC